MLQVSAGLAANGPAFLFFGARWVDRAGWVLMISLLMKKHKPWLWLLALAVVGVAAVAIKGQLDHRAFRKAISRQADLQDMGKRHVDWRAEARAQAMQECTNAVVGLTKVVRLELRDSAGDPNQWTGVAAAEFVNRVGGVERTNVRLRYLYHRYEDGSHDLRCIVVE